MENQVIFLNWYSLYSILGLIIPIKVYHVILYFGIKKAFKMWRAEKWK